jgi:hypothetical protein
MFWIKNELALSPVELIHISFWVSAPWTLKLIFSQFIDNISIAGNRRKSYILIGIFFILIGNIILISIANKFSWVNSLGSVYRQLMLAGILSAVGLVIQDLIADTLCAEVVDHKASPEEIKNEIGVIQILGRMSLMLAVFVSTGLGGYAATHYHFSQMVWFTLLVPAFSLFAVFTLKTTITGQDNSYNPQIILIGVAIVLVSIILEVLDVPYNQEIVFFINLILIGLLFKKLVSGYKKQTIRELVLIGIMLFAYRIDPILGPANEWWQIDVLKFDPQFFSILSQIGSLLGFLGTWLFSSYLIKKDISWVIVTLAIISAVLFLPYIGLAYGLQDWTMQKFGFGAKTIALVDTVMEGPFSVVIMVPTLAIMTYYAPEHNKPTWFALTACFLNLALSGGTLLGKLLNNIFVVERGHYEQISNLLLAKLFFMLVVPIVVVWMCNKYRKLDNIS